MPMQRVQHIGNTRIALRGVLEQRPFNDSSKSRRHDRQIRVRGQVLHDDLLTALPVERHSPREQFEQHNAQSVDVDLLAVDALADLGRHVVECADAFRLPTAAAAGNELGQAVVANLHDAFVAEDVPRLEVSMHDAVVVQVGHSGSDAGEPIGDFVGRHSVRVAVEHVLQALARDVLHHNPPLAESRTGCRKGRPGSNASGSGTG